jgi:hypothetical protein
VAGGCEPLTPCGLVVGSGPPIRFPTGNWATAIRRTVLVCVDGLTGCGGATAKIRLDDHTVQWSDFSTVPEGKIVALGPFTFDRDLYDQAIGRVERGLR